MRETSDADAPTQTAPASGRPILRVDDLGVRFGADPSAREVVCGVSYDLGHAETLAVVGESGSGKSVGAKALMALLPDNAVITRGHALFSDPDRPDAAPIDLLSVPRREMRKIRGSKIAMIFQEPMSSLSPFHTIGAQVTEALTLHRPERGRAARARCLETFAQVGFPDPERAYAAYPFELSGGLRQRAMIAMAMVCEPTLLIADEPTTALDVSTQAVILDLIKRLQGETGLSVLLITHDLGVVANAAHQVCVMSRGEVMEAGSALEILADPQHGYTRKLLAAAPRLDAAHAHRAAAAAETSARDLKDLVLEARDVRKTFLPRATGLWGRPQAVMALNGVDFRVPRGSTVALVGESGSGKTTLAKIFMRATSPDPGGALLYDCGDGAGPKDVATLAGEALQRFRREVQIVFQDPYASLSPRMTVHDILVEPLAIHKIGKRAERTETARRLIERVGLGPEALGRFPHAFSGGQRQRISIARALMLSPKVLICDEPTSALDVSVQAQVLDLLEELREDLGLSYLFVSHDLAVVARLADEIAVMCRGAIVEQAPTARLFEAPQHPYTQALMAAAPEPDPDRPLDLAKIAAGAGAAPENWPAPYAYDRAAPPPMIEVAPDHLVRRPGLATDADGVAA